MNTNLKRLAVSQLVNPLQNYKNLCAEISKLEKEKETYKKEILSMMDFESCDFIQIDDFKAERKLVVQTRIDGAKVKEILGDDIAQVQVESSFVKLTVI